MVLDVSLSVSSLLSLSCDSYIAFLHLLEEAEVMLYPDAKISHHPVIPGKEIPGIRKKKIMIRESTGKGCLGRLYRLHPSRFSRIGWVNP